MSPKKHLNSDATESISVLKSRFTELLADANALDPCEIECWIFCNGMLFNSPDKWWGDFGRRDFPHEGLDLCLYRDRSQRVGRIDENTRLPAMHSGVVKAIFKDYLGQAIVIEHDRRDGSAERLVSVYAHTTPHPELEVGAMVKEGDIIATLADTYRSKARIIPHLHFSLGRLCASVSYDGFVWNSIRQSEQIILLDPLPVLDRPHQAQDPGEKPCLELWSQND